MTDYLSFSVGLLRFLFCRSELSDELPCYLAYFYRDMWVEGSAIRASLKKLESI